MDIKNLVESYIARKDWEVKENANMAYSLQGLEHNVYRNVIKEYWLNNVYDQEISRCHREGWIHIHNLGYLSAYCVGWDLEDLIITGFKGASGKVSSKPAKHFSTILLQIVNFMYTLQGEVAGAIAFSNFDTLLAPFVRYDGLEYSDVKQIMQEFIFNMNVATRSGFQSPFTNLTFDLFVPEMYANKHVIIGGQQQNERYGDFEKEMKMINKAFIEINMEGDGEGRPFSFPIPTYNVTKNFKWNDEITDLIMQMTAKFGTPYFANFINSDMDPSDVRSMCCRLRLNNDKVKAHMEKLSFNFVNQESEKVKIKRRGGLFSSNPLTGSIGVVTVNLPKIGYLAKNEDEYFETLDNIMNCAMRSLEIKRAFVEKLTEEGLYPYSKFYLRNVKDITGHYWSNHFSTIGIVGMHESLLNFIEKGIESEEGINFAQKVLDHMLDKLDEFTNITGNLYNLEATPAESTSFDLAKIDKKIYPDIKTSGTEDSPYYTNSTMLPVDFSKDPFEVADHQSKIQSKYTGGTVLHFFVGEKITDHLSLKRFLKQILESTSLPYITITPTFSICPNHGYISGEYFECPYCGSSCEVYSRVVGYYRPVQNWNDGKRQEFKDRVTFNVK
jgi:ribonucleoside-triphosphate reductase